MTFPPLVQTDHRLAGDPFGQIKLRMEEEVHCYDMGDLTVLVGRESGNKWWHLSISHPNRYPTWDEIKHVRDELLPKDRTFVMFLPREGEYVNLHPNTFHLHEYREPHPVRDAGGRPIGWEWK